MHVIVRETTFSTGGCDYTNSAMPKFQLARAGVDLQSMTSDINLYLDPAPCLHRGGVIRVAFLRKLLMSVHRLIKSTTWTLKGHDLMDSISPKRHEETALARTYGTLPLQYYAADMAKARPKWGVKRKRCWKGMVLRSLKPACGMGVSCNVVVVVIAVLTEEVGKPQHRLKDRCEFEFRESDAAP